jgi:hypothetical protein
MSNMDYTRKKKGRGKNALGVNIIQLLPALKVNNYDVHRKCR